MRPIHKEANLPFKRLKTVIGIGINELGSERYPWIPGLPPLQSLISRILEARDFVKAGADLGFHSMVVISSSRVQYTISKLEEARTGVIENGFEYMDAVNVSCIRI